MDQDKIPGPVRRAASRFKRKRSDYYEFMAAILRSSGGNIKILQLFENDITRYEKTPRGTLAVYWYDTYSNNGGNLANTFQGIFPDDEVAVIRVAQDAGGEALLIALEDCSRMARLSDTVLAESRNTLLAGLIAMTIAILMLTVFPIFSIDTIRKSYDFLPMEYWGSKGKNLYAYAEWIKSYWIILAGFVGMVVYYILWSIPNQVDSMREWMDEHIVLYRTVRDLRGAMFLATMATLTRKRGGIMFTLKQSLETFADSAKTPWLKWRINQIIDGADATGAIGVAAFSSGLISKEMFFFLEDMEKAKGFAEGFEVTGRHVESGILKTIIKQMMVYRWVMLVIALVIGVGMFVWQFGVMYEMRGAMRNFYAQ